MPMPPQYLLLPASRAFISFSLIATFLLSLLPWGRLPGVPDFMALTLVFWHIHQPRLVGIGIAFLFGLLLDVHEAALLGQHALAYSLLSYGAMSLHRRVPWFGMSAQILHVLPLFLLAQAVTLLVRLAVGGDFPGWTWFLEGVATALLWPLADLLLLAPQRRAVDRDENRPI
jgi:rod shape-determining protein MreD